MDNFLEESRGVVCAVLRGHLVSSRLGAGFWWYSLSPILFHSLSWLSHRGKEMLQDMRQGALPEPRDGALFHTSFVPQSPKDCSLAEVLSNSFSSASTEHNLPPCCDDIGDSWCCRRLNVASFAAHALGCTRLAFGCRALGTE